MALPTVISFACGDRYYHESAARLRADCERLGIPHDIEAFEPPPGLDWSQICRLKVPFYARKLDEHRGPVLWVDVDCRILRVPEMLDGCRFDLAGYAQRFSYIRDFDPYDTARFWIPGVLLFNDTERSRAFVGRMNEIEQATTERITDDYCLQEAWATSDRQLNVGFLSPETVVRRTAEADERTVFVYGASGNVASHRDTVLQHAGMVSDRRRARVVAAAAMDVAKAGDRPSAIALLRRAVAWDPDDLAAVRRLSWYLRQEAEKEEARAVLEAYAAAHPGSGEIRQSLFTHALAYRRFDAAREQVDLLLAHPEQQWRDTGRSLALDLSLEERAAARRTPASKRTALWWMKTPYPGNFGDVLNPYVVEHVTGEPPRPVARPRGMLAIGSTIKFAGPDTPVWGTGTPRMTDELCATADYRAVRGPLTRELVRRAGGTCPEVYGDPGLLLPRFYAPRVTKTHALGLIRHVGHAHLDLRLEGVREVSVVRAGYEDIERFVDEVLACEAILSSSLHGLITAHAYGIPARWCAFGEEPTAIPGDGTKYEDYFRSVGLPVQTPLDLSERTVVDASLAREVDRAVDLAFDADALLAAFPA